MITDWRGNEIKVGSVVVYPSRSGSSLWMNEGIVVSVEEDVPENSWSSRRVNKVGVKGLVEARPYGGNSLKSGAIAYPHPRRLTVVED